MQCEKQNKPKTDLWINLIYTYVFEENSSCYEYCCYGQRSEQSYYGRNKDKQYLKLERSWLNSVKALKAEKQLETSNAC